MQVNYQMAVNSLPQVKCPRLPRVKDFNLMKKFDSGKIAYDRFIFLMTH